MLSPNVVEEVEIKVCGDCRIVIGNGDWSGIEEASLADYTMRYQEGMDRELGGRRGNVVIGDDEPDHNHNYRCDICWRYTGKFYDATILFDGFPIGQRVQVHPGCDCWMAGDRFGTVVKLGTKYVHVQMDVSKKVRMFRPDRIFHI